MNTEFNHMHSDADLNNAKLVHEYVHDVNDNKHIGELHIYMDCEEETITDDEMDDLRVNHFETCEEIAFVKLYGNVKIVRTTDLSQLCNFWDFIRDGWDVFVHSKGKTLEMKKEVDGVYKDVKCGCDVLKLLLNGVFES